jgi:hypothetical protein
MARRPRGALPGWKPTTRRQKGILADLVARYEQHHEEDTLPRGPRGIFYDLRPHGMGNGIVYRKPDSAHPVKDFDKDTEAHPEAVREVLVLARRAGMIPEHWVADARAPDALAPLTYDDADDFAEMIAGLVARAKEGLALDRQRYQPVHVEVLCEAEDLMPRLNRVAEEYGVVVYSSAGFDGLKGKRAIADRARARDVPTVVLHVGDRDDHGDNIFAAAADDAVAWARNGNMLRFERLALTVEQAEDHRLLDADGKAEVDGLPVPVMDRLLIDAIETLQDPSCREQLDDEEKNERKRVPDAVREALDTARR